MLPVEDLEAAAGFYTRVLGLRRLWHDASSVGLAMAETDAEIVLHTTDLPREWGVHYLVDDVPLAVAACVAEGCVVRTPPVPVAIGRVAVLEDPFGNALCLIDMSGGARDADEA
jgi:predicted enzyme related to lactoylglutathione lyase